MGNVKTVRLRFTAPVHFGAGRLSDSECACDAGTLFSALFLEALKCGMQKELLQAARSGELLLSDGFPYIGNDLYLPKPMAVRDVPTSASSMRDTLAKKATKKLSFIRSSQYRAFLEGNMDATKELELFKNGLGASFLQTKVNLTREHKEDAEPYHVGGFRFKPGAGMYFLVKGDYDLVPLLDQLQYSGLGGERSSGYGRFVFNITGEDPLAQVRAGRPSAARRGRHGVAPAQGPRHVLLSTAVPSQDELSDYLLQSARYKLVRRGGFVLSTTHAAQPQKKRDLYEFASGSMFQRTFEGDVFNVNATKDAHPVYRYARALWVEV